MHPPNLTTTTLQSATRYPDAAAASSSSSSSSLSSSFRYMKYCTNTPASNNNVPKLPSNQLKLTAMYFIYTAFASSLSQCFGALHIGLYATMLSTYVRFPIQANRKKSMDMPSVDLRR